MNTISTITITVAYSAYNNVTWGTVEGSGPSAESAARNNAREWYEGDVSELNVITLDWTGPVPTEHSNALARAITDAITARR